MTRFLGFLFAALLFASPAFADRVFITSGTTWTVPANWNSQDNTIEIIGAGADGDLLCLSAVGSEGGGGGAYVKKNNFAASPGASINIHFDGPSGSNTPGFVWFSGSTTVAAQGGTWGGTCTGTPGQGGQASASFGDVKFNGGDGGLGQGSGLGVGSGGGAAGLHGAGGNSGNDSSIGGTGDNGFGGAGGNAVNGSMPCTSACTGGDGTEWDATHGSGGGGAANNVDSGPGGKYGGGGPLGVGPAGGQAGLIVITWTPRRRVSSGVF